MLENNMEELTQDWLFEPPLISVCQMPAAEREKSAKRQIANFESAQYALFRRVVWNSAKRAPPSTDNRAKYLY